MHQSLSTSTLQPSSASGRVAAYVWGPDVGSSYTAGRSMQSAGGVGGLLMVLDGVGSPTGRVLPRQIRLMMTISR